MRERFLCTAGGGSVSDRQEPRSFDRPSLGLRREADSSTFGHGSAMIYGMRRFLLILICTTLTRVSLAQKSSSGKITDRSDLATVLGFEAQPSGGMPGGWGGGPAGTIFADDKIVHGGQLSARIERSANRPNNFSTITKSILMDFARATLRPRLGMDQNARSFGGAVLNGSDHVTKLFEFQPRTDRDKWKVVRNHRMSADDHGTKTT